MAREIGLAGAALIGEGQGVLTHCNAGGLATADFGTALAVIFTGLHITGLMLDKYVGYGPSQVAIPLTGTYRPVAVAWGIVAAYLLTLYHSLAVLTDDAVGVLEDVEVGRYHDYE